MTSDHPVRRLLVRVCSADTMARVVDPTLADVRWESGRPSWLGYLALTKALGLHAIVSTPSILSRIWSDDGGAIAKSAAFVAGAAIVAAAPLIAPPLLASSVRHALSVRFVLLLAPQALALTVPAALLLAVPLALRHQVLSSRLARRTIGLSIVCMGLTFALVAWAVPWGNQAFRVGVSGDPALRPGPLETGLVALRERIETLNLTPGGRVAARKIEYVYQMRLALACAPLALGVLALGIAASPPGRRRPWLTGFAAMVFYVFILFPLEAVTSALLMRSSSLPPVLFAWTPNAIATLFAALLIRRSRRFPIRPLLPPPASPAA